eukprot:5394780-Pyramimonas_sp.AAC.1
MLREYMLMDKEDGEALKTAKQALEERGEELMEHGSYKTCTMGAQKTQFLKALDFVDKWSDDTPLSRAGWDWDESCACSRGLAFPNKL